MPVCSNYAKNHASIIYKCLSDWLIRSIHLPVGCTLTSVFFFLGNFVHRCWHFVTYYFRFSSSIVWKNQIILPERRNIIPVSRVSNWINANHVLTIKWLFFFSSFLSTNIESFEQSTCEFGNQAFVVTLRGGYWAFPMGRSRIRSIAIAGSS